MVQEFGEADMSEVHVIRARKMSARERVNMPMRAWRAMKKAQGTPRQQLERILEFAHEVENTPAALRALIRIFGMQLQAMAFSQVVRQTANRVAVPHAFDDLFFDWYASLTKAGQKIEDLAPDRHRPDDIDMRRDIIIPQPWSRGRLAQALENLAPGGEWGPWKSEPNHQLELLLPMRIVLVNGGNHSLTAGIALDNVGVLKADLVVDLSTVIARVRCDGEYFRRTFDDAAIGKIASLESAAIWEISRLRIASATRSTDTTTLIRKEQEMAEKQKPKPPIVKRAAILLEEPEKATNTDVKKMAARILDDQKNDPEPHKPAPEKAAPKPKPAPKRKK